MNHNAKKFSADLVALLDGTMQQAKKQEPGHCDPSTTVYKLAEMVMSDCGHSSNNQRLLDRIADRIQRHMDDVTPPAAQRQPLTEEQREEIAKGWRGRNWTLGDIIDAIEAAHGIGEKK